MSGTKKAKTTKATKLVMESPIFRPKPRSGEWTAAGAALDPEHGFEPKTDRDWRAWRAGSAWMWRHMKHLIYAGQCVYCGAIVSPVGTDVAKSIEQLKEHVLTCRAGPYVAMVERLAAAERQVSDLRDAIALALRKRKVVRGGRR